MPGTHAFLSPSAAHRWMNCPQAPSLEEAVEDRGSVYAAEGTLAHAVCEAKLHALIDPTERRAEQIYYEENGHEWFVEPLYHPEMDDHTDYYRDTVYNKLQKAFETTPDAKLIIEQKLDFRTWIPDGFGTADAIIIADGTMEVIDFKYGKGVEVSATNNPQMMIYALGALEEFGFEYDITDVRMTIIQPRIDNVSEFDITARELIQWGTKVLQPAAAKAFARTKEQHAGTWCKFCAVKAQCKELASFSMKTAAENEHPELMDEEKLAEILKVVGIIKNWCTDVEAYALQSAIEGHRYPGFKLVEGRSIRVITDTNQLANRLNEQGFEESQYFKPKELQTITNLEKLVGKKAFAVLADGLIDKPQGKPTLVPESDKRKEWSSAEADFAGIQID